MPGGWASDITHVCASKGCGSVLSHVLHAGNISFAIWHIIPTGSLARRALFRTLPRAAAALVQLSSRSRKVLKKLRFNRRVSHSRSSQQRPDQYERTTPPSTDHQPAAGGRPGFSTKRWCAIPNPTRRGAEDVSGRQVSNLFMFSSPIFGHTISRT